MPAKHSVSGYGGQIDVIHTGLTKFLIYDLGLIKFLKIHKNYFMDKEFLNI